MFGLVATHVQMGLMFQGIIELHQIIQEMIIGQQEAIPIHTQEKLELCLEVAIQVATHVLIASQQRQVIQRVVIQHQVTQHQVTQHQATQHQVTQHLVTQRQVIQHQVIQHQFTLNQEEELII